MTKNNSNQKHIFSILVENHPGVLSRIAGLFSARGYNIESLCVASTIDPQISRVSLVTKGDELILEQIKKQLNKIINVIKVYDYTDVPYVQRDLALVKVKAKLEHRAEILRIVDIFRSRVVDVSPNYYTLEITGNEEKIEAFLRLLKPMGIKEIARTGPVALARES